MSTHLSGFHQFFKVFVHNFILAKLATTSVRVNVVYVINFFDLLFPIPCFYLTSWPLQIVLSERPFDEEYNKHHKYTLPAGCKNLAIKK